MYIPGLWSCSQGEKHSRAASVVMFLLVVMYVLCSCDIELIVMVDPDTSKKWVVRICCRTIHVNLQKLHIQKSFQKVWVDILKMQTVHLMYAHWRVMHVAAVPIKSTFLWKYYNFKETNGLFHVMKWHWTCRHNASCMAQLRPLSL